MERQWPKASLLGMAVFLGLALVIGCGKKTTEPNNPPSPITGKVIDASENGVKSVSVLLSYHIDSLLAANNGIVPTEIPTIRNCPNPFNPVTTIRYSLPEGCYVKLWIADGCTHDTVVVLVDGYQEAGSMSIGWDGRNSEGRLVVNGVYEIHLQAGGISSSWKMFYNLMHFIGYQAEDIEHNALTDDKGNFEISQSCLPFGFEGKITDYEGNSIGTFRVSRYVKIWALHNSYHPAFVDSVFVDDSGANAVIQFSN